MKRFTGDTLQNLTSHNISDYLVKTYPQILKKRYLTKALCFWYIFWYAAQAICNTTQSGNTFQMLFSIKKTIFLLELILSFLTTMTTVVLLGFHLYVNGSKVKGHRSPLWYTAGSGEYNSNHVTLWPLSVLCHRQSEDQEVGEWIQVSCFSKSTEENLPSLFDAFTALFNSTCEMGGHMSCSENT